MDYRNPVPFAPARADHPVVNTLPSQGRNYYDSDNDVRSPWQPYATLCVLLLVCGVLGGVGLVSSHWSVVVIQTRPSASLIISNQTTLGLFQTCSDTTCSPNSYADYNCIATDEPRAGNDLQNRVGATKAMIILAIIGCAVAVVMVITLYFIPNFRTLYFIIGLLWFVNSLYAIGLVVYVHTYTSWVNCGYDFCANMEGVDGCTWSLGYAFYMIVMALGFGCASSISSAVVLGHFKLIFLVDVEMKTPGFQLGGFQVTPEGPPPPTMDTTDWRLDPASGLYYSSQRNLFLDPNSREFYDPQRAQWYDPNTSSWHD